MGIISALIQFLVGIVLWLATAVLSAFSWTIPTALKESITWYFLQLNYFRGVFPIETLLQCIGTMFLVWGFMYAVKIFFHFVVPLLPFIGRFIHLPQHNPHGNVASSAIHLRENFRNVMRGPDRIHR